MTNKTKKLTCPVCDSGNIQSTDKDEHLIYSIFGDAPEKLSLCNDTCNHCLSNGDFRHKNTKIVVAARDRMNRQSFLNIVSSLPKDIRYSHIELVFGLPQKTIEKWKVSLETPPIELIHILKMVSVFPWLLEVADNHYDNQKTKKIFCREAQRLLIAALENLPLNAPPCMRDQI